MYEDVVSQKRHENFSDKREIVWSTKKRCAMNIRIFFVLDLGLFFYLQRMLGSFRFPITGWFVVSAMFFVVCWIIMLILKKIPIIREYI